MKLPPVKIAIVTVCGLGFLRPAPGTWGSIPAAAAAFAVATISSQDARQDLTVNLVLIAIALVASLACLKFAGEAEGYFGRKDAPQIVIDEVAGQAIALLLLPWRMAGSGAIDPWKWNLALACGGFVLFRAMDILKPPPARGLQRIKGGAGVLVDDLIAGLYALVLTQIFARFVLVQWL